MCSHTHEQPAEPPADDDPLKRWKAHPIEKKKHTGTEFIEETMR